MNILAANILVFDTETTGVATDRIVELGAVVAQAFRTELDRRGR